MTAPKLTIKVRMYHVGFGDSFLVTVTKRKKTWRMLIDCGVHSHGQARPIEESVATIISDLQGPNGDAPALDVVVATHHHADHISGFAVDAWDEVEVGEVWLPWVEDPSNEEAVELRQSLRLAATRLGAITAGRAAFDDDRHRQTTAALDTANALAMNARGNEAASERLRGNSNGFVDAKKVRYLPEGDAPTTELDTTIPEVLVHALGPSRDQAMLKRMNPPRSQEWLVGFAGDSEFVDSKPLFDPIFSLDEEEMRADTRYTELLKRRKGWSGLEGLTDDLILLSATKLERWCNNTSLFLVLQVGDRRLVFPGDAQEGAWQHVMDDPTRLGLIDDADLYKISHHGSHNGTPRRFVDDIFRDGKTALLPFKQVAHWKSIPKRELLEELDLHHTTLLRADQPPAEPIPPNVDVDRLDRWTEVTL